MATRREDESKLMEDLFADIDFVSGEVDTLQRGNWASNMSLVRLLKNLLYSRLLYKLSNVEWLSPRRRERFFKSAEKRDPMLLVRKVDQFCIKYYQRINENEALAKRISELGNKTGLKVTAIVPNYNHAKYLPQRIESILNQTYPLIDVIVLDDCSTDNSREVIEAYVNKYPTRIKSVLATKNSGNVFRQWQKGHSQATGDIVWICESDDFCEPTFVERAIRAFRDPSVMLSFGSVQYANTEGEFVQGLDDYREECEPGIWNHAIVRPASEWFCNGFGVKNVIPNVGGSLWRRFHISEDVWTQASEFKIMGDWFLYSVVAGGGQIAYEPTAITYFRIHSNNTSGKKAQRTLSYYDEYFRIMKDLRSRWPIPEETLKKFLTESYKNFKRSRVGGAKFEIIINADELKATSRVKPHVLIGLLGFTFGGGEIFPIHLANALHELGVVVSLLQIHTTDDQQRVKQLLNPAIPVFNANHVREMGVANFLERAGVSIVHSHVANVDKLFLENGDLPCVYFSTLHGSYEAMKISKTKINRWSKKIDRFAYLAERNRVPFEGLNVPENKFLKVRNAIPLDERPFPKSRADLGIPTDAIVFCLAARGIEGKGWTEAVSAYVKMRERRPDIPTSLLMAGEGSSVEDAKKVAANEPTIHFLGFVSEVHGLYRISDVALLPSRYPGESFPLSLIQAFQVGVPCIATDIGEIKRMAKIDSREAGIIFQTTDDTEVFVDELSQIMEKILDESLRAKLREAAIILGKSFDINQLASEYLKEYLSLIEDRDDSSGGMRV
ncbi:glycosyltransferase [Agrobacterium tumefaciens]|uniref:Glycosyltransferase n=1 Tax=Agrobacterium tumefaciens TaxID=358 RepID=A0A546XXI4_AGRTU|nr:glycosyltransferase [Agrobacterium tumefaciens]TRB05406.1 glycosyltransferase [Agrobacterium tumefaciens]